MRKDLQFITTSSRIKWFEISNFGGGPNICSISLSFCFNNKSLLKATKESDPKLAITESLTRRRSKLLEQSKKVFGFQNVWTHKGNIFCSFEGKRHRIDDFANIARIRFPEK